MKTLLIGFVEWIALIHSRLLTLNDAYEYYFTDKQLHFLVIGLLGLGLVFLFQPLFTLLAKHDHVIAITFIYVFTLIIVFTFAIEIGQGYSGTGTMDFTDIMSGVNGFLLFFIIFAVIRGVIRAIVKLIRGE